MRKFLTSLAVKLLLKLTVTIFCFWYISTKIDFGDAFNALFKSNWWILIVAVFLYALSKVFSSFRLNIFFKNIDLKLSQWENLKLYWLGMFYNLFLPGSIGGDAYKVILLSKKIKAPYKKTSAAVLLDRFSGVLGLGLLLAMYGVVVLDDKLYDAILIGGALVAIVSAYIITKFFFKEFLPGFWPTFFWGLMVQATQIVCVYSILLSLHLPLTHEWIFIFLLASVISVFPISMGGGLGTRELVFAEGARFFGLDPRLGVTISLLFFLCNIASCIWGIYFVFKSPINSAAKTYSLIHK